MKTLNQIKSVLETIATNHKQINSFGFGDIWEYTLEEQTHPVMWASLQGATVSIDTKELEISFSLWFMDLVNKDERNETEVLSDQLLIATDVISLLNSDTYYDSFFINSDVSLESFTEKTDNEISGWKTDIRFRLPYVKDTCYIPD